MTQRWRCWQCPESGTVDSHAEKHTKATGHTTSSGILPPDWDAEVVAQQR